MIRDTPSSTACHTTAKRARVSIRWDSRVVITRSVRRHLHVAEPPLHAFDTDKTRYGVMLHFGVRNFV